MGNSNTEHSKALRAKTASIASASKRESGEYIKLTFDITPNDDCYKDLKKWVDSGKPKAQFARKLMNEKYKKKNSKILYAVV